MRRARRPKRGKEEIDNIRRDWKSNKYTRKELCEKYDMDAGNLSRILNNKTHTLKSPSNRHGKYKRYETDTAVYGVFADGRVWSFTLGRFLTPDIDRDGYRIVTLSAKKIKLHRLVLTVWKGPPKKNNSVCRHKDGDVSNNHYTNLCWGSVLKNNRDKFRHGTHCSKLTYSDIKRIRKEYSTVTFKRYGRKEASRKKWLTEMGNKFNVHPQTIDDIVRYNSWKFID